MLPLMNGNTLAAPVSPLKPVPLPMKPAVRQDDAAHLGVRLELGIFLDNRHKPRKNSREPGFRGGKGVRACGGSRSGRGSETSCDGKER